MTSEMVLPGGVVRLFMAMLRAATSAGATDQTAVLRLLHAQLPNTPELALALAQQYIHSGDLTAAAEVLERADARAPRHPVVKALLAWTLHAQDDKAWQAHLHELEQLEPNELACMIAAAIG